MSITLISVIYKQYKDGTFDAFVQGMPHILVKKALDLCEARTFIRILFKEEVQDCRIVKEFINYYYEGT